MKTILDPITNTAEGTNIEIIVEYNKLNNTIKKPLVINRIVVSDA